MSESLVEKFLQLEKQIKHATVKCSKIKFEDFVFGKLEFICPWTGEDKVILLDVFRSDYCVKNIENEYLLEFLEFYETETKSKLQPLTVISPYGVTNPFMPKIMVVLEKLVDWLIFKRPSVHIDPRVFNDTHMWSLKRSLPGDYEAVYIYLGTIKQISDMDASDNDNYRLSYSRYDCIKETYTKVFHYNRLMFAIKPQQIIYDYCEADNAEKPWKDVYFQNPKIRQIGRLKLQETDFGTKLYTEYGSVWDAQP